MANLCSFIMRVKGRADNLRKFDNIIVNSEVSYPKEKYFRRCEFELLTDPEILLNIEDDEILYIDYSGTCAWSVGYAMAYNNPNFVLIENDALATNLQRESELLALDIEVFSEEGGCGFQEHYLYKEGWQIENETVDFEEIYNEETDDYERIGGFESWEFTI